jgi:hypothetical protein
MGRGYTSHNVWPVSSSSSLASSSSANANANAKELSSKEELLKKEEDETDNKIADKIVKILTPLIESIKGLGQGKSGNDGKGDEVEKKLDAAKQREKVFIICLIVFGLLAFFSFLSAVWSANSVEKLLRILYKMKQSKS